MSCQVISKQVIENLSIYISLADGIMGIKSQSKSTGVNPLPEIKEGHELMFFPFN